MAVHQYRPTGLLKFKKDDVTLVNRLLKFLPVSPFTKNFRTALNAKLSPFLQADFDIWLETVEILKPHQLKSRLPACTALAEIALPPRSPSMLLELDLALAQQAVDRILGGQGLETDPERPLSDIEEGIFTFILLKALDLCQNTFADENGIQLQLLEQSHSLDNLLPEWEDEELLHVVGFRVFMDLKVGYLRLIIPERLLQNAGLLQVPTDGPTWQRLKANLLETFRWLDDSLFPLQVEAGRSDLSLSDLRELGDEDIILLENTDLKVNGEEISGEVRCTFGKGIRGYLRSDLKVSEEGIFQVVVRDILAASPPTHDDGEDGSMEDQDEQIESPEEAPEENLQETKHLLEDVTVPMVVEMGRLGLTAMEIAQLRSGTIFELGREPGADVNLVIDGKHIGEGELVDIEGQLGVRVLSLHRGDAAE